MFDDDDLLNDFVIESLSHLVNIDAPLLEMESDSPNINHDQVNSVFRSIHSIKGASGFLGLTTVNRLSHSLESVLNLIRNDELIPSSDIVNSLLVASDQLRILIENALESNSVDVSLVIQELDSIATNTVLVQSQSGIDDSSPRGNTHQDVDAMLPVADHAPPSSESHIVPNPSKFSDSSIRVQVALLDRLMNLAGELVLSRNQLLLAVNNRETSNIENISARIDQVTSDLQETIMQTRMQPIGNVMNRFPRLIRDLGASLDKEIRLEIEGSDVELDKTIVEAVADPLTHLIRNCADHGIEPAATRAKLGKPQIGTIRISAFHQSGKVCIRIEDDGAGIDPNLIRSMAIENNLMSQHAALSMSDADAIRFVFTPGFSTATQVTELSGRGVGMDVVRANIEQLGGTVDIESRVGQGTAVHITLPLTLAIIPSMIVGCAEERFAIPQANISELVRIAENEKSTRINTVQGAEVLELRGNLLPLVHLASTLGFDNRRENTERRGVNILVLESGHTRYGLVVDTLHDNEEIVVKPLGKHLRDIEYIAGATILGDGYVAIILDVVGLANHIQLRNVDSRDSKLVEPDPDTLGIEQHRLLLFANHPEELFAVPMAMVSRIERVRAADIKSVGGRELVVCRGSSLPILRLETCIESRSIASELHHLFVIVLRVEDREVGLVAPILRDIRNIELKIDTNLLRVEGVTGSLIVDDETVRLLDFIGLVRPKFPDWFEPRQSRAEQTPRRTSILVAEDSDFFRNQVTKTLESEGFNVIGAVDGKDAWERLETAFDAIDLIITDIEMPRMNGLDLARAIRSNANTSQLPIIALTSLATEDDRKIGSYVGINDYQVKMDPTRLIQSVRRMVSQSKLPHPSY